MNDSYTIDLETAVGVYAEDLSDFSTLECARAVNGLGNLTLKVRDRFALHRFRRDMRLKVWRTWTGAGRYLVGRTPWFVRSAELDEDLEEWTITATDSLSLLDRRLIAYAPETLYADKTIDNGNNAPIDNLMRAYVRENGGTLTVNPSREYNDLAVEINSSSAPGGEKEAGWRNLLTTLKELADDAEAQDFPLFFDVDYVETRTPQFLFTVRPRFLGVDRTSANNVLFARELGNLRGVKIKFDYSAEKTFAYIGGDGQGLDRLIWTYQNIAASTQSPFGRIETFVDAGDAIETTVLEGEGRSELTRSGAKLLLTAELLETEGQRFGRDFDYGDLIPIQARGVQFSAHLDAFRLSVARGQATTLDLRVKAESELI